MNERHEPTVSWRTWLDGYFTRLRPAEKEHLLGALGVERTTMLRWRNGQTTPANAQLHRLLEVLPEDARSVLYTLLLKDPLMRLRVAPDVGESAPELPGGLPLEVYQAVLALQRDLPDPFWLGCETVLARLRALFVRSGGGRAGEGPSLELVVALCTPPGVNGRVRSLYEAAVLGTPPWRGDLHERGSLLGSESLAGQALLKGRGLMDPGGGGEDEAQAAIPIGRRGMLAGAFLARGTSRDAFPPERLALLEQAATLLGILVSDALLVPWSVLSLGCFPPREAQQPALFTFARRVTQAYQELSTGEQQADLAEVERRERSRLEEELLVRSSDSTSHP